MGAEVMTSMAIPLVTPASRAAPHTKAEALGVLCDWGFAAARLERFLLNHTRQLELLFTQRPPQAGGYVWSDAVSLARCVYHDLTVLHLVCCHQCH